jgi:hypothetical protein
MSDLRKLIDLLEYIENGGELIRERDITTGRIVSKPVNEVLGKLAAAAAGAIAGGFGAKKFSSDKSDLDKPGSAPAGDASLNTAGNSQFATINPASDASGRNADGSYNSDSPFAKAMDAKMKAAKNPNGNGGHDGSGIDPNDDPTNPKIWPPGVRQAPDYGYLDPQGMWIPTPFHIRTEDGDWRIPRTSPANRIGIPMSQWTPFQRAVEKLDYKSNLSSSSAIEQTKPMQLPGGAPQIPGYKQINASQFSTDAREPGLNKTLQWVYAYQKGKNIILIAPYLFYNVKLSIGRFYRTWDNTNIRSGGEPIKTANGKIHVSAKNFPVNDMIFDVVIHATDPSIGPKILQSIKI